MGWDAFAQHKGKWIATWENNKLHIPKKELAARFHMAAQMVLHYFETADSLLQYGGLDCSDCAQALTTATGVDWYCTGGFTAEQICEMTFTPPKKKDWASESAYWFLRICQEEGLSVRLSW